MCRLFNGVGTRPSSISSKSRSCFKVVLLDVSGATLGAQTLGADHTSLMFSGLIPGRLYRSEVITHSGELTNSMSALGRTCEKTQSHMNRE